MMIGDDTRKASAYDCAFPEIQLKKLSTCTSISLPSLETMQLAEAQFGEQKDMYKNANIIMSKKKNFSRGQAQHAVFLARLKENTKKSAS